MKIAVYAGSFNPPTLGHVDIIQRASLLFEKLYIALPENQPNKTILFTAEERREMLQKITKDLLNVEIICFKGLLIDFAKQLKADCLIRGMRNYSDFDSELQQAHANKKMGNIETLHLMTDEKYISISSSLIREIASCGRHLHGFVPREIEETIYNRLHARQR